MMIVSLLGFGQSDNFQNFGVEQGLIQSQVECIEQDQRGYLWIGTIGGLTIYNGYQFKSFTTKEGLSEDWISAMHMTKDGDVWMGHWAGGITLYKAKEDTFVKIAAEDFTRFRMINDITQVGNDFYFAVKGAGIIRYSDNKFSRINLPKDYANIKSLMYEKNTGLLWMLSNGQVLLVDLDNSSTNAIQSLNQRMDSSLAFTSFSQGDLNEVWLGTKKSGVVKINTSKGKDALFKDGSVPNKYISFHGQNGELVDNHVKSVTVTKNNGIWISTSSGMQIYQFKKDQLDQKGFVTGAMKYFSSNFKQKYLDVNCLFEDREHNVWIGSDIGLNRYNGELFSHYSQRDLIANNLVWVTLEDRNKNIWVGTSKGISKLHFKRDSLKNGVLVYNEFINDTLPPKDSLLESVIISLAEDDLGRIWMGTESKGVNVYDPISGKLTAITKAQGIADNHIFSLLNDSKGNMWIGTKNGVTCIPVRDSIPMKTYTKADGIGGNKVYDLLEDSKGVIWMAILGGRLTKYANGEFQLFGKEQGLDNKFVLSVTEDVLGEIWVGTYLGGVYRLSGGKFKNYKEENGLSSNSPLFVQADNKGYVWIGNNKGIDRFNINSDNIENYSKQYGIKGLETNENSSTVDAAGNIWFGTINGLTRINPSNERPNEIEPLTAIEGLKIRLKDAPFPENATFSYDENEITFDVIGVSLTNPKEVSYSYLLEGGYESWSPRMKKRSVSFNGLPPGDYKFRIKAYNNHGVESKTEEVYSFTILPPFWMTWWFQTAVGVTVLLIIVLVIKTREARLKKTQRYLETQVAERTEELRLEKETVELQRDEIEEKNHHITQSINYSKRIQDSILPPKELIAQSLPQHFVYFNPRDIVSGDFYWVYQEGNKVLYAAADCTGHGVPGAFMSLIGHYLLEKIVGEYKILQPAKILDKLSEEIITTLRQDNHKSVKDGMDISICSIDFTERKVEFAGANNPLYLVRNGEMIVVDADTINIGKSYSGEVKHYSNKVMDLQEGDCLYTFSDGYVDQFGGKKGKKFLSKRFRELLVKTAELPIEEQEARLADVMEQWKGERRQLDDMIVFGVKV